MLKYFLLSIVIFLSAVFCYSDAPEFGGGGGGSGDVTIVGDCTTGPCFDGTAGTILTFNNAGGDGTIEYDGSKFIVSKDLTISGDDLYMATNTSGAALIADGTNFNPVVISGDVAIGTTGTAAIQADSVALTTDTSGNYVLDVADGTGIDGTASGEGTTYTPTLDLTEISSATLGAGSFTTLTFDAGASDPVITAASGGLTVSTGTFSVGTAGVKLSDDGDGQITFTSLGNGSGAIEDISFNLDDTADTVTVASSTGVTSLNFTSLNLGLKADDQSITLGTGSDVTVRYFSNTTSDEYLDFSFVESDGQSLPGFVLHDASYTGDTDFDNITYTFMGLEDDPGTTFGVMGINNVGMFFNVGTATANTGLNLTSSEVVVNEVSISTMDFRAESDSFTNALFVDASTDSVGIFNTDPAQSVSLELDHLNTTSVNANMGILWTEPYTLTLLSGGTTAALYNVSLDQPTANGVAGGGTETVSEFCNFYVKGAPLTGTNITVTRAWAAIFDAGDVTIDDNLIVGGSTSRTETIANAGFSIGGDDLWVAGSIGVEGGIYSDGAVDVVGAITGSGNITSSATGTIGWSVVAGADTACTTTCTSACVAGFANAASGQTLVACSDATADSCLCGGAS